MRANRGWASRHDSLPKLIAGRNVCQASVMFEPDEFDEQVGAQSERRLFRLIVSLRCGRGRRAAGEEFAQSSGFGGVFDLALIYGVGPVFHRLQNVHSAGRPDEPEPLGSFFGVKDEAVAAL